MYNHLSTEELWHNEIEEMQTLEASFTKQKGKQMYNHLSTEELLNESPKTELEEALHKKLTELYNLSEDLIESVKSIQKHEWYNEILEDYEPTYVTTGDMSTLEEEMQTLEASLLQLGNTVDKYTENRNQYHQYRVTM